jgi:hypothetical protein
MAIEFQQLGQMQSPAPAAQPAAPMAVPLPAPQLTPAPEMSLQGLAGNAVSNQINTPSSNDEDKQDLSRFMSVLQQLAAAGVRAPERQQPAHAPITLGPVEFGDINVNQPVTQTSSNGGGYGYGGGGFGAQAALGYGYAPRPMDGVGWGSSPSPGYNNYQPSYTDQATALAQISMARADAARRAGRGYEATFYENQAKQWNAYGTIAGGSTPGYNPGFGQAPQIFQTPGTWLGMFQNPAAPVGGVDPRFYGWVMQNSGGRPQVPTWHTDAIRYGGEEYYEPEQAPMLYGSVFSPYNNGDYSTQESGTLRGGDAWGAVARINGPEYYDSQDVSARLLPQGYTSPQYDPSAIDPILYQQLAIPYSDAYLDNDGWTTDNTVTGYSGLGSATYR